MAFPSSKKKKLMSMRTEAARRHRYLETILAVGEISGKITPEREEEILTEMGRLWWDMNPYEQAEADRRIELLFPIKDTVAGLEESRWCESIKREDEELADSPSPSSKKI